MGLHHTDLRSLLVTLGAAHAGVLSRLPAAVGALLHRLAALHPSLCAGAGSDGAAAIALVPEWADLFHLWHHHAAQLPHELVALHGCAAGAQYDLHDRGLATPLRVAGGDMDTVYL